MADKDADCKETVKLFVEILGAHCGSVVLSYLCTAGVYLGGGIVASIKPFLKSDEFIKAYISKGRLSPVVEQTPVHLIEDPDIALEGAARIALSLVGKP